MDEYSWYQMLVKPTWAPPSYLFGPVWTVLYLIIAISFGFVIYKIYKKELSPKVFIPFGLNLFFNFIFTTIQFGLQNNLLAFADILLVLLTILWLMKTIWSTHKWVALINIPYLMWVSFATVLQATITYLNF